MRKWPLERICRWLIGVLLCVSVPAWMARRLFGVAELATFTPILSVASLLVLLLSYYAVRHPQVVQPTGNPVLDEEINRILRYRALKPSKR